MVFFTCNGCNESLKKNQCEKHISICRRAQSFACVDCGKDFWGKDYQTHVKCISEEEKYSGKDYKPKPNANKGEKKQEQWISQVQEAINRSSTSPQLRNVLQKLLTYTNIPRKKAKFENFIRNSMKLYNEHLIGQMWTVLEESKSDVKSAPEDPDRAGTVSGVAVTVDNTNKVTDEGMTEVAAPEKLSKREKKEARKQQQHKREKKDKAISAEPGDDAAAEGETGKRSAASVDSFERHTDETNERVDKDKKKKKKRKNEEPSDTAAEGTCCKGAESYDRLVTHKKRKVEYNSDGENETVESDDAVGHKKRKTTNGGFEVCPLNQSLNMTEEGKCAKFSIPEMCITVVNKYGEISLKKLVKKVAAEYLANFDVIKKFRSEEELIAKIEKKVKSNPGLSVRKDTVKLRTQ